MQACFICENCNNSLGDDFFEFEEKRLCKNCASSKVRCTKCSKPIVGQYLTGGGSFFHVECVDLHTVSFLLSIIRNIKSLFRKKYLKKCPKCKLTIKATETKVQALGSSYHSNCFVCTGLKKAKPCSDLRSDGKRFILY